VKRLFGVHSQYLPDYLDEQQCGIQDTHIAARLFSITSSHIGVASILQWKGFTRGGSGIFKADKPGGLGDKSHPMGYRGKAR